MFHYIDIIRAEMLKNLHMLLFKRKTLRQPILVFLKMASNMYIDIYKNYHMNYVYVQKYYNIYIYIYIRGLEI